VLWIDAICINQQDITEHEQQVGIMGDIYRNAKQTPVWLGDGPAGHELIFSMLQRMYDERYERAASADPASLQPKDFDNSSKKIRAKPAADATSAM
jgi:hypothetical protein